MSDEATPQTAANPSPIPVTAPPVQTPATPQAAAPAPPAAPEPKAAKPAEPKPTSGNDPKPQKVDDDSNFPWLPDRLKQARGAERNALLREFGVESADDIKTQLARLKELEDAQLTEQERVAKQLESERSARAKAEQYQKPFTDFVTARFEALTPEQQALIDAKANGDPLLRHEGIQYIDALARLQPISAPEAPPAPPKPASTVPEVPKPPVPNGGAAKTKYEQWIALRDDPKTTMQASLFYRANRFEIDRSRPQTT